MRSKIGKAAVLVLLSDPDLPGGPDEPDLLLTRRALTLRSQPGQISFPGGKMDPGETPQQTALREAHEEIGLDPLYVNVQRRLAESHIMHGRYTIVPILGTWDGTAPVGIASPEEVDSIYRVPLREFADPANRVTALLGDYDVGPGFALGEISVWGFTARVIDDLLRDLGIDEPWDEGRLRAVPEGFR